MTSGTKRAKAKKNSPTNGLWIDYGLLRKHMRSDGRIVLPADSLASSNNRFLQLADIALGNMMDSADECTGKNRKLR